MQSIDEKLEDVDLWISSIDDEIEYLVKYSCKENINSYYEELLRESMKSRMTARMGFKEFLEKEKVRLLKEKEMDTYESKLEKLRELNDILKTMDEQYYVILNDSTFYPFKKIQKVEEFCNDSIANGKTIKKIIFGKHSNDTNILDLFGFRRKYTEDIYYLIWAKQFPFINTTFSEKSNVVEYIKRQKKDNGISPVCLIYGKPLKFYIKETIEIEK